MTKPSVHSITDQIPAEAICEKFAVKERSIRLARERGVFPASWNRGMRELCREYGIEFNDEIDDLFNWKTPETSERPIKRGAANGSVQGGAQ